MNLKGHDLNETCHDVFFESGNLRFACAAEGSMTLVIVPPQDPDYLPAMRWAIQNNHLQED